MFSISSESLAVERRLSAAECAAWFAGVVGDVLSARHLTDKEAARDLGCSPRTVENWRKGLNVPAAEQLREIARVWPETRAAVRRFFCLEAEFDPEAERLLSDIYRYARRRAGG
jgi:transcriptional regulator with XRE-family HTH domain